jgi:hypothetical protein
VGVVAGFLQANRRSDLNERLGAMMVKTKHQDGSVQLYWLELGNLQTVLDQVVVEVFVVFPNETSDLLLGNPDFYAAAFRVANAHAVVIAS